MIKLENVKKIYSTKDVDTIGIDDISLEIGDGEFVAITGASGSGKSTLLNIIGAMDTLTSGKYFFDETEVSKLATKDFHKFRRENISFVFQNFELLDEFTVYENIAMPLVARKISKKKQKEIIQDVLEKLDIVELDKKYPSQLSGGQKQRVAIARALACDVKILLADEPTGSLDEENGQIVMDILKDLNSRGKTVIVITHNPSVANQCDRIINLKDGKID